MLLHINKIEEHIEKQIVTKIANFFETFLLCIFFFIYRKQFYSLLTIIQLTEKKDKRIIN